MLKLGMYITNFVFIWLFGSRAHFISLCTGLFIVVIAKTGGPQFQDNRAKVAQYLIFHPDPYW